MRFENLRTVMGHVAGLFAGNYLRWQLVTLMESPLRENLKTISKQDFFLTVQHKLVFRPNHFRHTPHCPLARLDAQTMESNGNLECR
jgi:hypothetical protein